MKTTLKQIVLILFASGFLAFVANSVHPRRIPWTQDWSNQVEDKAREEGVAMISFSAALDAFEHRAAAFIDARSREEFERGRVPKALSVPLSDWENAFPILVEAAEAGAPLILYCSTRECDDALTLALTMRGFGATNTMLFVDGFAAWEKLGGPVER